MDTPKKGHKIYKISVFDKITNGQASSKMVSQHERVLSRLIERKKRTLNRVLDGLSEVLPADVDTFIEQLEKCGECENAE